MDYRHNNNVVTRANVNSPPNIVNTTKKKRFFSIQFKHNNILAQPNLIWFIVGLELQLESKLQTKAEQWIKLYLAGLVYYSAKIV